MMTAILAFTSVSAASAAALCHAGYYIGQFSVVPGGWAWGYWINWTPALAGGTYVQTNTHNAPFASFHTQGPYSQTRAGGFNANSFTTTTAGFANVIYLC